jgi:large subunit ribosomal protein L4
MSSVQVVDLKGKSVGEVNLSDAVFNTEVNQHVMHLALVRQLANGRSGSASTKTRAEVSGGGRKPWRQKGTGRARVGSIRSPLWRKGGVVFGPKPRDFSITMPKKVRQLALKSALAAKREDFMVISSFAEISKGEHVKTKTAQGLLKDLKIAGKKILVLLDGKADDAQKLYKAFRNIALVEILYINNLNVKNLLDAEIVLTAKDTLTAIDNLFTVHKKEETKAPKTKTAKAEKAVAEEGSSKSKAPTKESKAADKTKSTSKKSSDKAQK